MSVSASSPSCVSLVSASPSGRHADLFSYVRQCYQENTFSDLILKTSADLSVSLRVHRLVFCSVFPNLSTLLSLAATEEDQQQLVILADIPVAEVVTLVDSVYASLTYSGEVVLSVPKGIQQLLSPKFVVGTVKKKEPEEEFAVFTDSEIKAEFADEDLDEVNWFRVSDCESPNIFQVEPSKFM